MSKKNDGGPVHCVEGCHPGMTLRQYYAAAALKGMAANHAIYKHWLERNPEGTTLEFSNHVVLSSFRTADAMLAHEQQEQDDG